MAGPIGRLAQLGTPDEIYDRPATRFVATFVGSPPMNVLDGTLADGALRGPGFTVPALTPIGVDGVTNSPDGGNDSAEVTLDICVAGAVAQGAKIAVYFAPFTEQGWIDILTTAIQEVSKMPAGWAMPSVISGR